MVIFSRYIQSRQEDRTHFCLIVQCAKYIQTLPRQLRAMFLNYSNFNLLFDVCTMKRRFCPRLTFRASWKIILFALLKAYERIIKYVAPTSWKFMPIINQYFFSRISSSALLCGLVSLVRTRNRVTLDLPMSPRWSD